MLKLDDLVLCDLLTNQMTIHLNVLGTLMIMKNQIFFNVNNWCIVTL